MAYSNVIAERLSRVQKCVMGMSFESLTLDSLLPILFEECLRENMIFYFSFVENYAVLNLRSVNEKHDELNIRQYYETPTDIETLKMCLLINTFHILKKGGTIHQNDVSQNDDSNQDASSAKQEEKIIMGNNVPPTAIRTVIDLLNENNEPVIAANIEKYLQLGKLSKDNRSRCIAYLCDMKKMEAEL